MTVNDHKALHRHVVNGKNYIAHWEEFVAKGKPTQAQLDTFLKTIERDFSGFLQGKAHKTKLRFDEWGRYSTKLKDDILTAKQNPGSRVCVMLRRAGVLYTVGVIIYNANSGGVVFAAEQAAKDLIWYDDLDPLLKYAAHSASTHIVTGITGRPDGCDWEVNSNRCELCNRRDCRCGEFAPER